MDDDDIKKLLLYIETAFVAMSAEAPRKPDGAIDIVHARGVIIHWEQQGVVSPFVEWRDHLFGDGVTDRPEWPEGIRWPPWEEDE